VAGYRSGEMVSFRPQTKWNYVLRNEMKAQQVITDAPVAAQFRNRPNRNYVSFKISQNELEEPYFRQNHFAATAP
jgi:hypothetical protein